VTLQPIQDAGRVEAYDAKVNRLTVSEIRRRIAEQTQAFTLSDIIPVPCNPDTLAMGYALKLGGSTLPLTRLVDPQILLKGESNTITFEHDPAIKKQIFELFSTNQSPDGQAAKLSELLCCIPKVETPAGVGYRDVFRVLIVQFMDALSLDIRALKKSCIHIAQPGWPAHTVRVVQPVLSRWIEHDARCVARRGGRVDRAAASASQLVAAARGRRPRP
jgi:hypothetical protein